MYSEEDENYRRYQAELRRRFRRTIRIRRAIALLVLILMAAAACFILFLLGKGIVSLVRRDGRSSGGYVDEAQTPFLDVVDNRFSDEEKRSLFGSGPDQDQEISEDQSDQNSGDGISGERAQTGQNRLIVIDAGHGGYDSGTFNGDIMEKDVNLSIAYYLKQELEARGYTTYLTRTDDTFVGLQKRANLANDQTGAKAMVSIHQNSYDGPEMNEISGVEAWTYKRSGCIEFAELLAKHVSEAVDAKNRGVQYRSNLVVTSKTEIPSVIIECGYISNDSECAVLNTADYQKKIAYGIANAVDKFIKTYYQ